MKILFLIDHLKNPHAGTEGQLYKLVHALTERGVQCHLAVLKPSVYLRSGAFPCPWSSLDASSLASPTTWRRMHALGRSLSAQGFRLAHTFFNDVSVIAPPMLALSGMRTVISRRDMGFWYSRKYTTLLRTTRRWVSACVTNSDAVAEITAQRERIPPNRMQVIYNGLEMPGEDHVTSPVPELEHLRTEGRVLAGLVANIRPIKRMEDLIDAVALARDSAPMLDAVIIGDGDSSALKERARNHGVAERVHFLGPRNDVPACLHALDIGVLCSESEGFSNALVEYMAAGLPSVCTDTGGNPEAIDDARTGFLYPGGDVEALSRHLVALATDAAGREATGQRARQEAQRRFSVDAMVNAHSALYQRLLSES
ncbi:MAG: glycosyltransferase [Ectothiorhodospiraceae bacterium]|nr:glycosyltransferase [Ectothiorhodospiraceae bacterium]